MRLWLLAAVAVASTACGAQVDGDQWHRVTLRDDLGRPITVAGHKVAPGKSAVVTVNQNTGSKAYAVSDETGHRLGCLPVDHDQSLSASTVPACPGGQ